MKKRNALVIFLLLNLLFMFFYSAQPVRSLTPGTIYILPDGTIEGTDKIQKNGNTYVFTENITVAIINQTIEIPNIVIQRDNIVVDGQGFALLGPGPNLVDGITISNGHNITIRNLLIEDFRYGVFLNESCTNNTISENALINNSIELWKSSCHS